jgi:hypothetical protein
MFVRNLPEQIYSLHKTMSKREGSMVLVGDHVRGYLRIVESLYEENEIRVMVGRGFSEWITTSPVLEFVQEDDSIRIETVGGTYRLVKV